MRAAERGAMVVQCRIILTVHPAAQLQTRRAQNELPSLSSTSCDTQGGEVKRISANKIRTRMSFMFKLLTASLEAKLAVTLIMLIM